MIEHDEPVGGFFASVRQTIMDPHPSLVGLSTVMGLLALAVMIFAALAGLTLLCWNAFIHDTLGGPVITYGGSCGLVGLVLLLAALIVAIGMLLVDRD